MAAVAAALVVAAGEGPLPFGRLHTDAAGSRCVFACWANCAVSK